MANLSSAVRWLLFLATVQARTSPALLALGFVDHRIVVAALRSAHGRVGEAATILGVSTLDLLMLLAEQPELMNAVHTQARHSSGTYARVVGGEDGKDRRGDS